VLLSNGRRPHQRRRGRSSRGGHGGLGGLGVRAPNRMGASRAGAGGRRYAWDMTPLLRPRWQPCQFRWGFSARPALTGQDVHFAPRLQHTASDTQHEQERVDEDTARGVAHHMSTW